MVGVDAELGVDEEEEALLDGVQTGNGPPLPTRNPHRGLGFHVQVHTEDDVLAAVRPRG